MKTFLSSLKVMSGIAVNAFLFHKAIRYETAHRIALEKLSAEKLYELKIRDFALKNDPFYRSEVPYLRAMSIAGFQENTHAQLRARHQYLDELRAERDAVKKLGLI